MARFNVYNSAGALIGSFPNQDSLDEYRKQGLIHSTDKIEEVKKHKSFNYSGLSALDVDRINRNAKPLDKEEREIHKRLMPKQKTKTISISQLGNYINGGYYKKNSTGHLKDL